MLEKYESTCDIPIKKNFSLVFFFFNPIRKCLTLYNAEEVDYDDRLVMEMCMQNDKVYIASSNEKHLRVI
jgi:hypothetical protein